MVYKNCGNIVVRDFWKKNCVVVGLGYSFKF